MRTKKLLMLLLTTLIMFGATRVNVFAKEQVNLSSETTVERTKQVSTKSTSYTKTDLRILTAIIYCEAGYESYQGKLAVGNVILNRVNSNVFDHANTVREVVYDLKRWGRQFSPAYVKTSSGNYTTDGSLLQKALKLYVNKNYTSSLQKDMMEESEKAAIAALEGKNIIGDYLYFNSNVSSTKAMCKKNNKPYTIIGSQIFY